MTHLAKPHGTEFFPITASESAAPRPASVRGAFALSACLHGGVAALLVLAAWTLREEATPDEGFILVSAPAGETRRGEAGSAPGATNEVSAGAIDAAPDFRQEMARRQRAEERRAEREIARMREQQRIEEARQAVEAATRSQSAGSRPSQAATVSAEARRTVSHAEFLRSNRRQSAQRDSAAPGRGGGDRSANSRIDLGQVLAAGSGASGPATSGPAMDAGERTMEAYFRDLTERLRAGHEKPGGLGDLLSAEVRFTLAADGAISDARITRSSGDPAFDQSVLDVFSRVRMPARPDGKSDARRLTFRIQGA